MNTNFRTRLKHGDLLIGTVVTLSNPSVVEVLINAGFDWFFVDLEHSPMDVKDAQAIQQAVGERAACILRLPLNDEIWIKKSLDTGVAGIMLPQVNNLEDARRAVRLSKYPPQGSRSIGAARANDYGSSNLQTYAARANLDTIVVAQVETIEAVRNLEGILSVEGLDAVLVGPYDLSASMGLIGQVEHADVQANIAQVQRACQAHSLPIGIYTSNPAAAITYIAQGFSLIAFSADILLLDQAGRDAVKALR